uniref:Uncharacterized protein n=1 Tax=Arundo donax TaxID=35708 RepID=A0A0A9D4Y9_ARUDO
MAAGGVPPGPPRVCAGGTHGRGTPGHVLPPCGLPRFPRPLPRAPVRRIRGQLPRRRRPRGAHERRLQEVVGAVVAVPGGLPRARLIRAAPGVRLLAGLGAAAPGAWRRTGTRARRAGAAHEGRDVRPVQGAAVRGDEGQVHQRCGRGGVAAAPVVPPEHCHCLPARRRRRRIALRQVHPLRLGWWPTVG